MNNENDKEFKEKIIMTAKEARDIANKKNEEIQKVESLLLNIGKFIGKVAKEGGYTIVYNIEYNTDEKIVTLVIDYLKSLGYRVTETDNEYFRKLIIEFN